MEKISYEIRAALSRYGYRAKTVAISHLPEVQESVGRLVRQGLIDKQLCENWHFYLKTSEDLPGVETIIVVAMPQPLTRLTFERQGRTYIADMPPTYFTRADKSRIETALTDILETAGYRIVKARLALKTLAVRSGLAEYGKNNISYVPGMGSFHGLIAYFSDCPCDEDSWREPAVMKDCDSCSLCREKCPTGSITADRFLIHAEKCPGFLNQKEPDFPHWVRLQPDLPNALIGCMACQFVCPVNKLNLDNISNGPSFSEEETGLVLQKTLWAELPPRTRQKLEEIRWAYQPLAANLGALIEKQNYAARQ